MIRKQHTFGELKVKDETDRNSEVIHGDYASPMKVLFTGENSTDIPQIMFTDRSASIEFPQSPDVIATDYTDVS